MESYTKSIGLSVLLLLSSCIGLAASSSEESQSWVSRMADRLAKTSAVQAAGNLITRWAVDAVEADKQATVRSLRERIKKEYSTCEDLSKAMALVDDYHACVDINELKVMPTAVGPKGLLQSLLILMQITAQFLPEIRFNTETSIETDLESSTEIDSFDQDAIELSSPDVRPELSAAGRDLAVLAHNKISRFDVCHQAAVGIQLCCALHDNSHISCCLIDGANAVEVCDNVYLRGYPEQSYSFDTDAMQNRTKLVPPRAIAALRDRSHIDFSEYKLFQDMVDTLTAFKSVRLHVYKTGKACDRENAVCYKVSGAIELSELFFFFKALYDALSETIAHELGHHQQAQNNPGFYQELKRIDTLLRASSLYTLEDIKRFNAEIYADLMAVLLLEPSARTKQAAVGKLFFLAYDPERYSSKFKDDKNRFVVTNDDRCDFPSSFTAHPDDLLCRLPRVLEAYEKLGKLVPDLEKKIAKLRKI